MGLQGAQKLERLQFFNKKGDFPSSLLLIYFESFAQRGDEVIGHKRIPSLYSFPQNHRGSIEAVIEQCIDVEQDTSSVIQRGEDGERRLFNAHCFKDRRVVARAQASQDISGGSALESGCWGVIAALSLALWNKFKGAEISRLSFQILGHKAASSSREANSARPRTFAF